MVKKMCLSHYCQFCALSNNYIHARHTKHMKRSFFCTPSMLTKFFFVIFLLLQVFFANGATSCLAEPNGYQKYTGKVYHVFFHSLIIDTDAAFSGSDKHKYDDWMTTRSEFNAMLEKLYANGFVLIDLTSLAEVDKEGRIIKKELLLPPGKKPLVMSFDDVNYYEYMKGAGFAERLALDQNGNITTIVLKDGVEVFDCEGDAAPILDAFVMAHPDFSPYGAKGILAVTGFEGVFGYRVTSLTGAAKDKACADAKAVADRLKATGWRIACHSYTHSSKFRDRSITLDALKRDTAKWKDNLSAIVGETSIYVTPFGCSFAEKDMRTTHLISEGFRFICPVCKEMTLEYHKNYVLHGRLNLDGLTMRRYPERIQKYFFNPSTVLDPSRPPLN